LQQQDHNHHLAGGRTGLKPAYALIAALILALVTGHAALAGTAGFAWTDPDLGRSWPQGRNPIYQKLEDALTDYRATWGALPSVAIARGPALRPGAHGPRLAALRERLGLAQDGSYGAELVQAVSRFQHAHGLDETGVADAATIAALNAGPERYERVLEANLERARALPPSLGKRYILVDAAVGRLWLYDHGEVTATMKVVTGKPAMPTPIMAAEARELIFNPYWNVPEDLVRNSVAPKALAQGMAYIERQHFQVLSDYTDEAYELNPETVDWAAVAHGKLSVRVRQRPGPGNMMGQVKLMLPNPLGVYLHDTPLRADFGKAARLASSGCVRLEDALTLARALVGDEAVDAALDGSGEERPVALKKPVPIWIVYFTAWPGEDGIEFRKDVYRRDDLTETKVADLAR
jgi:murein L,D-transpeptidase YcbB/YkuD